MELRAEIESVVARLRDAIAQADLDAARRLVLAPSALHAGAPDLLPPPSAPFVGVAELGEGWVCYGVAVDEVFGGREPTVLVTVIELFRTRDGALRLANGSSSGVGAKSSRPADLAAAFASHVSMFSKSPPARRGGRAWSPLPSEPTSISAIRWIGPPDAGVPPGDVDDAERAIGARFPPGYREYVERFGSAIECGLVRVYPPGQVVRELAEWRMRVDAYWFWAPSSDGLDRGPKRRAMRSSRSIPKRTPSSMRTRTAAGPCCCRTCARPRRALLRRGLDRSRPVAARSAGTHRRRAPRPRPRTVRRLIASRVLHAR